MCIKNNEDERIKRPHHENFSVTLKISSWLSTSIPFELFHVLRVVVYDSAVSISKRCFSNVHEYHQKKYRVGLGIILIRNKNSRSDTSLNKTQFANFHLQH